MNHAPHSAATAGNGGNFDPQQAAALLDHTTQQARRQLAPSPPWLLATRAVAVLAVCGAAWLSVRGQHPYQGPTAAVIPVLVAFIVLNFGATVAARERALAGVRGITRLRPAEITIMVVAWATVPVLIWALAAAGGSVGRDPTTVLIAPGLAWAAVMAARAGWRSCGTGLAVAVVGVAGAFAGPAGAWAVAGAGLCAVLLGKAAAVAWRQRRSAARP
jgi:hypothetical protein